jgi:O-antigen/teichoic acid export membrane protein
LTKKESSQNPKIWAYAEAAANPALTFVVFALLSRGFNQDSYGHFIVMQSWAQILAIASMGLPISLQVEVASERDFEVKKRLLFTAARIIATVCVLVLLGASLLCILGQIGLAFESTILMACYAVALIVEQTLTGGLRGFQQHRTASQMDLASRLAIVCLVAIIFPSTEVFAIIYFILISALTSAAKIIALRKALKTDAEIFKKMPNTGEVTRLLKHSPGPLLQQAAGQCFSSADKILIGSALSTADIAPYSIMQQVSAAIHIFSAQFQTPMISEVASSERSKRRGILKRRVIQNILLSAAVMILILSTWRFLLPLVYGANNTEAITAKGMMTMCAAYFLVSMQTPIIYFLQGIGKTFAVGWIWLLVALGATILMYYGAKESSSVEEIIVYRLCYASALIPLVLVAVGSMRKENKK